MSSTKTFFTRRLEFKHFIAEFIFKYPKLKEGKYFSDNKKYAIDWRDGILEGERNVVAGRVINTTGVVELDKNFFGEDDAELLYYMIVWFLVFRTERDLFEADRLTVEHFITYTDGDYSALLKSFEKLIIEGEEANEVTEKRLKALKKMKPTKKQIAERKELAEKTQKEIEEFKDLQNNRLNVSRANGRNMPTGIAGAIIGSHGHSHQYVAPHINTGLTDINGKPIYEGDIVSPLGVKKSKKSKK